MIRKSQIKSASLLACVAALSIGTATQLSAATDDDAFYRCQEVFGIYHFEDEGTYALSEWRWNSAGGVTCTYTLLQ